MTHPLTTFSSMMQAGSKLSKPIKECLWTMRDNELCACALGAVLVADLDTRMPTLINDNDLYFISMRIGLDLKREIDISVVPGYVDWTRKQGFVPKATSLELAIIHLNDNMDWEREAIAEWLCTSEVQAAYDKAVL